MAKGLAINNIQPPLDFCLRDTSALLGSITGSSLKVTAKMHNEVMRMPIAATKKNQLEEVLRAGQFAVTAELSPPDTADPSDALRRYTVLSEMVDAINITDGSRANCHIFGMSVAALLANEGLTPVMQVTCRDRNRIAVQGDILGAAAYGISDWGGGRVSRPPPTPPDMRPRIRRFVMCV